jgi:hypothetical protein
MSSNKIDFPSPIYFLLGAVEELPLLVVKGQMIEVIRAPWYRSWEVRCTTRTTRAKIANGQGRSIHKM